MLTRQSIAAETDYDPWPEIEAQATALAGPGATVTAAPASASVLVTGTPRDVGRVRAFLRYLNREVLRPVTLSVHVYTVRMERGADYGIGLAALVRELFGTSAQLAVSPESVAVVRPSSAVGDTLSATVRALSRAGTVSRVLSADIPSLNGKPAQFFELYKEAYVKEHRTTAGEGIAQTEIVPGTVSSGFAASYIPRITGPGEVLVRLFASLRDRPVFREVSGGGATIQLPAYASRAVQVTQRIRRGETLLVTGFSSRRAEADGSGTFTDEGAAPRRCAARGAGARRAGAAGEGGDRGRPWASPRRGNASAAREGRRERDRRRRADLRRRALLARPGGPAGHRADGAQAEPALVGAPRRAYRLRRRGRRNGRRPPGPGAGTAGAHPGRFLDGANRGRGGLVPPPAAGAAMPW